LPVVFVSEQLLLETGRLLETFGTRDDAEGVVYWLGLELGPRAVIASLVVPNADTRSGSVRTTAAANAEAVAVAVGTPLVLLGQAHSHPGALVRHSWIDDRDTFAQFEGALSVVVPHFGRAGLELERCGVYRYCGGCYRLISRAELGNHLRVIPGIVDLRRRGSHSNERSRG
jgi:proteasome lid subunit RPN8/RPN11